MFCSDIVYTNIMTRALEDNAFATGLTIFEMMKKAGKVVAEEVIKYAKEKNIKKIAILSGFGNNGGDGVVATSFLLKEGYSCSLVLVGKKKQFNSKASQENFKKLKTMLAKEKIFQIENETQVFPILSQFTKDFVILDALLGIGVKGEPREPIKSVIEFLNNNFKGDIISLDTPSGYDSETSNSLFVSHPKKIICLGRNKIPKGKFQTSEIVIRSIGIPKECENFIGIGDVKWFYPKRKLDSHKRQNGVITVIAGSIDYIGAPALVSFGALRTGVDLVFILTPENIRQTVASFAPDFITIPANKDEIHPEDITKIYTHPRLQDSTFVIGPGMMNTEITRKTLLTLLETKKNKNIVIDASALTVMKEKHLELLKNHKSILTPHKGEFHTIFGLELSSDVEKNAEIVTSVAKRWRTTILLKGQIDIISNGNRTKLNKTGHPGMTVGGTGDVLSGITAAILSVTNNTFLSSSLAAYISGKAGELAADSFGDGLVASDIPDFIPQVIKNALMFKAKEI
ncbi:MAG: NAD(P)H-hydrate dehydratase [Candidatus Heimdallarchaeaceae archaeon]